MADFYLEMQQMARELLAPTSMDGLGQGEIVLSRITQGVPPNDWTPPEETIQSETIRGAVRGISKELVGAEVGGTVLLMSDRQAITEVPAMAYTAGDILSVDGVPVTILSVTKIPAAGITSAVKFLIRG